MACSRPTSDVASTGSGRGPRGRGGTAAGGPAVPGGELLAQQHGQVVAHQPAQLRRRAEVTVGDRALRLDAGQHPGQPRLPVRRRHLDVQQPGKRLRQLELVLQTRDLHARPDPPVPLPVQADEHITLRQVRPIQLLRRVRPRPELEHHRRQPQRRDGPRHCLPLLRELAQRGTHEHPQTTVRSPDHLLRRQSLCPRSPPLRLHPASVERAGPTGNTPRQPTCPSVSRQRTRCHGRDRREPPVVRRPESARRLTLPGPEAASAADAWTSRNWHQLGVTVGAGGIPTRLRIRRTLEAATR